MKYLYKIQNGKWMLACFTATILLLSCKKFVDIGPNPAAINPGQSFADSANANSAIVGMYINMMGTGTSLNAANGAVGLYTGLYTDEFNASNPNNVGPKDFFSNAITPENAVNASLWSISYKYIYHANACIAGAGASTGLSMAMKNRIIGEALFVRSHLFFTLMNMYGKVPLVKTTDFESSAVEPRSDTAVVYNQIIGDLLKAYDMLQTDPMPLTKARPNKYTVQALLARVYLFRKQWAQAEASASIVLDGNYGLVNNIDSAFLTNNREAIWQIPASFAGTETVEGNIYVPANNGVPNYYAVSSLLNAYEQDDKRRIQWFQTAGTIIYPFKYKLRNPNTAGINPKEAYTPFRLSEQFLIRAEARAWLNNIDGAKQDLDKVRMRAGLKGSTASFREDVVTAVLQERRVELFGEWGHRFFDLKRTGNINVVMNAAKPTTWKTNAALFPIPQKEILLNPFLEPNP